jgi:hypothetical protein
VWPWASFAAPAAGTVRKAAFNLFVALGWQQGVSNATKLHFLAYYPVRTALPDLNSNLANTARAKAAEAIRSAFALQKDQDRKIRMPHSDACPPRYNIHTYRVDWESQTVRLSLVGGRQTIRFRVPDYGVLRVRSAEVMPCSFPRPGPRPRRRRLQRALNKAAIYALLTAFSVVFMIPAVWLILSSFKWNIFLFRQFFSSIPRELEEAATIDGAGRFRTFWNIILPNSKAVLAIVTVFTIQGFWTDLFNPVIYLNTPENFTLALGVTTLIGAQVTRFGPLMAASVLMTVPMILLYFMDQRYIEQGVVTSGIK